MARNRVSRILVVLLCLALALSVPVVVYFRVFLGKLTVSNFIVKFSTIILFVFLLILILRYICLLCLSYLRHMRHMSEPLEPSCFPPVSVLVPAYNEGMVITSAVRSLMKLDYPSFEVIIIDDGSTDDTHEKALELAADFGAERVRVLRQENAGKAVALNTGIAHARAEFVLCMDGDSRLEPQTLRQAIKHFADPTVGAVAGNVKVTNRLNVLTRLQALEYLEGLNLVRTAQSFFDRVTVIPGPIGIFRKTMLAELGGYLNDSFAEDCDITIRIVMANWKIRYESQAIAWTEAPESAAALFKQRYRWTRGILQVVAKHKRVLFSPRPNPLNWLLLVILVFESVAMPSMNVFGMLFFIFAAISGGPSYLIVLWWAQLTVLDLVAAIYSITVEEEDVRLAPYAILYRLFFIPYVDVMRFFSTIDEFYGVEMAWGSLQRLGRI